MSTATLTSLAILKVNLDQGGDYLDYLRPFVLQVLADNKPERVSDAEVAEVMAYSYAAVQPSAALMDKFLKEIDKLRAKGSISQRDHLLLRSTSTYDNLMDLTLGDEAALTDESMRQMLERATAEIEGEQAEKMSEERVAHEKTRAELAVSVLEARRLRDRLYRGCKMKARVVASALLGGVGLLVVSGLLTQSTQVSYWLTQALVDPGVISEDAMMEIDEVLSYAYFGATALSLVAGVSLLKLYRRLFRWFLKHFARQERLFESTMADMDSSKG